MTAPIFLKLTTCDFLTTEQSSLNMDTDIPQKDSYN